MLLSVSISHSSPLVTLSIYLWYQQWSWRYHLVVYINSDIWWSFGKDSCFHRSYSGDPYWLELRIKSLLISVDEVVHTTKDRREGDRERRPGRQGQVMELRLYVERPCRSFDFDLLQPYEVELFDANSNNPNVRHWRPNLLEPDFLYGPHLPCSASS